MGFKVYGLGFYLRALIATPPPKQQMILNIGGSPELSLSKVVWLVLEEFKR